MVAGFQRPLGAEAGQLLLLRLPVPAAVSPAWCLCCIEERWPSPQRLLPEKRTGKWYSREIFFVSTSVYSEVLVSKQIFCVQTWIQLSFILWTPHVLFYLFRFLQRNLEGAYFAFSFTLNSPKKLYLIPRDIRSIREPAHTWREKENKIRQFQLGFFFPLRMIWALVCTSESWVLFLELSLS